VLATACIVVLEACAFLPLLWAGTSKAPQAEQDLWVAAVSIIVLLALFSRRVRPAFLWKVPWTLGGMLALALVLNLTQGKVGEAGRTTPATAAAPALVSPPAVAPEPTFPPGPALAPADLRRLARSSPAPLKSPVPAIAEAAAPARQAQVASSAPPDLTQEQWSDCLSEQVAIEATGLYISSSWKDSIERYNAAVRAFDSRCGSYAGLSDPAAIGHRLSGVEIRLLNGAAQARARAWMLQELRQRAGRQARSGLTVSALPGTERGAAYRRSTAAMPDLGFGPLAAMELASLTMVCRTPSPAGASACKDGLRAALKDAWVNVATLLPEEKTALRQICLPVMIRGPVALRQCERQQMDRLTKEQPEVISTVDLPADDLESLRLVCLGPGTAGPASLRRCERSELQKLQVSGPVSTADLLNEERESLELACLWYKDDGPSGFRACKRRLLAQRHGGPDLSGVSVEEYGSAAAHCIEEETVSPHAFDACLLQRLKPHA
jgi:hypothetical protein